MKLVIIGLGISISSLCCAESCDQDLYDQIYMKLSAQVIQSIDMKQAVLTRQQGVDNLRRLCKGQISTYESNVNVGGYEVLQWNN